MSIESVVKTIAECVSAFRSELRGSEDQDRLKSFRSRARDIPTLVFTRGLAYALVYVASRSSEEAFRLGLTAIGCSDLSKKIRERVSNMKAEESGYVLYGALLAFAMKTYGIIVEVSGDPFERLVKASLEDPVINARALEVVEWIKRFAEAYVAE